jgi:hypothetical protein
MGGFCTNCGSKLDGGQKFCVQCGQKVSEGLQIEVPSQTSAEEKRSSSFQRAMQPGMAPPPPPPTGQVFVSGEADLKPQTPPQQTVSFEGVKESGTLPPGVQSWGFQNKTTEVAAQIIQKLNQSGLSPQTAFGNLTARMIRACLLDKTIYRETLIDASLDKDAWKVIGLVVVFSSVGPFLLSFSLPGIMSIISTCIIQLVSLLAWVLVVQIGSSIWLERKMSFNQFFRPLAFAQSPGILQILPVVGQIVGIWRVVTSMAAIRDVTGCQTFQAAILAVIGYVGAMAATRFIGPILRSFF